MRYGAGYVVVRQRIARRHGEALSVWTLPGGGVEQGESIFEAAKREVVEETGLEVRVTGTFHLREVEWNPEQAPQGWNPVGRRLDVFVVAEVVAGALALGHDPEVELGAQPKLMDVAVMTVDQLRQVRCGPEYLPDVLGTPMSVHFDGPEQVARILGLHTP